MQTLWLAVAASIALALPGCTVGGSIETTGARSGVALTADLPVVAYQPSGPNTADIYLSDLSRAELDAATPFERITGHLVHIHLFVTPRPGKTSIDPEATNATVRHVIFSGDGTEPHIGVYQGAGFLLPRGDPGGPWFAGKISQASVALLSATPAFADLLGTSESKIRFRAPNDPTLARFMDFRMRAAMAACQSIDRAAPAGSSARSEPPESAPESD